MGRSNLYLGLWPSTCVTYVRPDRETINLLSARSLQGARPPPAKSSASLSGPSPRALSGRPASRVGP